MGHDLLLLLLLLLLLTMTTLADAHASARISMRSIALRLWTPA
jgi:hypothetical protein